MLFKRKWWVIIHIKGDTRARMFMRLDGVDVSGMIWKQLKPTGPSPIRLDKSEGIE